jgi:iron complex transport system substrate-binding protein
MTRRGFAAAALAVAVALAGGCSRAQPGSAPAREAHRIVSTSPGTTEALFAVGAGDRVVGRSRFCDYPPEASRVPAVGGVTDTDFEAVVQLGPDLVVGVPGLAALHMTEKLATFGIPTWFPNTDSLAEVDAMILGMGQRTGHADDARRVVDRIDAQRAAVSRAVATERAPRVLLVVDLGPVVATGPKTFLDEVLRTAGGVNVLSAGVAWQTIDFEQIAELDPDVVVDASSVNVGGPSRITADLRGWGDVRAVREGRVVAVTDPRVLRPGPRVSEGIAALARGLHPRAAVPDL